MINILGIIGITAGVTIAGTILALKGKEFKRQYGEWHSNRLEKNCLDISKW